MNILSKLDPSGGDKLMAKLDLVLANQLRLEDELSSRGGEHQGGTGGDRGGDGSGRVASRGRVPTNTPVAQAASQFGGASGVGGGPSAAGRKGGEDLAPILVHLFCPVCAARARGHALVHHDDKRGPG
jgi:hypothetical protein